MVPFGNVNVGMKRLTIMARCAHCGKTAQSGNKVSFSARKTKRRFHPNLQRVTILENGKLVHKVLCTKCIKTLVKV
jgi:large subunit ribosomal protein L28